MSIAMRYARNEHDAADIMSIAFVKVFRSIKSFEDTKGNFYSWLKKIIINEAIDFIKQQSKFSGKELTATEEPVISSEAIEKMDASEIMQMIRQLPPATHAVFVMFAIEGFSHKEIAAALQISEGTSKWHVSEARKYLQQKILNTNK